MSILSFEPEKKYSRGVFSNTKFLFGAVIIVVALFFFKSTFAANITVSTGQPVEFGQGVSQTTACSGATAIVISPTDTFSNSTNSGSFYFNSINVSNIPTTCYGDAFTIDAYNDTSSTALALYGGTGQDIAVGDVSGSFYLSGSETGLTIVTNSTSSFTVTFTTPVALSTTVFKLGIQSSAGVTAYQCFTGRTCTLSSWSNPKTDSLRDVKTSSNGQYAIAGGSVVEVSANYGVTWATISGISSVYRVAISPSGQYMVAGVAGGYIYISTNYGSTFSQTNAPSATWEGVYVSADGQHLVGLQNPGYIYYSANGGSSWTQSNSSNASWFTVTASSDGAHVIAGEHTTNYIWYSSNYGATWTQSNSLAKRWQSVAASSDGSQVIANDDITITIFRSTDYGATWSALPPSHIYEFVASSSNGQELIASTSVPNIYISFDSGSTWSVVNSAASLSWQGVAVSGDGTYLYGTSWNTAPGVYVAHYS